VIEKVLPGQPLASIQPAAPKLPGTVLLPQPAAGQPSFRQQLDESLRTAGGVKFSAHAVKRLESRGISLKPVDVSAIEDAVARAAAKGSRDSLVLGPRYAMVVNIPSRTVITAFDQDGLNENVVTNIDSAVFVM
jgi:flagellar operon protein